MHSPFKEFILAYSRTDHVLENARANIFFTESARNQASLYAVFVQGTSLVSSCFGNRSRGGIKILSLTIPFAVVPPPAPSVRAP